METRVGFDAETGLSVPAVTADQMQEVDRIAVEEFGPRVLQMMENAGRNLALSAVGMLGLEGAGEASPPGTKERPTRSTEIAVLAGPGGGGLCAARRLQSRRFGVRVALSKEPEAYGGTGADQLGVLRGAGAEPVAPVRVDEVLRRSGLVVDAPLGYSLRGTPRGPVAQLIESCN